MTDAPSSHGWLVRVRRSGMTDQFYRVATPDAGRAEADVRAILPAGAQAEVEPIRELSAKEASELLGNKAQGDLKTILDHMGSDMSLHVDDVALERLFGSTGDAVAAAEEFANPNYRFIRDQIGRKAGRFVRLSEEPA